MMQNTGTALKTSFYGKQRASVPVDCLSNHIFKMPGL